MVASGFFVSRASHGKAGALSMVGRSSFSRVIPGGATVFRATSARNIAHTGRRRSPARASGADFRVSRQGGNMSSLAEAPDAEIGGVCLAAKDLFNVTSFRGSPPFLFSLFSSCLAPFGSPRLSTSRASLESCLPSPSPTPSPPVQILPGPGFRSPGFVFSSGVDGASPFAAASAGDWPFRRAFLPRARHSFPSPGTGGVSNLGSAPRAKKKAAVLCGNGGLFPVGWRTTGTFWD